MQVWRSVALFADTRLDHFTNFNFVRFQEIHRIQQKINISWKYPLTYNGILGQQWPEPDFLLC